MAVRKKEKKKYTVKELKEFEKIIKAKLNIAGAHLDFYKNQLSEMTQSVDAKTKDLDDGTNTMESERIAQLALRQQKLIQHLENALLRIKNKVYGICRVSGKLISKERLKAVPHATLSIEAKQRGLG